MKKIFLFSFFFVIAQVANSQNIFADKQLQKLYDFQDRRQADSLLPYFAHPTVLYRQQAVLAFASLQTPQAANLLLASLQDTAAAVRRAAAYSLGQIASTDLQPLLISAFEKEPNTAVKTLLLEAIGKTSNEVNWLASQNFGNDTLLLIAQGKALYRAVTWKKTVSEAGTNKILDLLTLPNKDIRFWAASYLARNPQKTYTNSQVEKIITALQNEKIAFVKMNLASSLSNSFANKNTYNYLKDSSLTIGTILQQLASKDENYLVRINALRALNRFDTTETQKIAIKLTKDRSPQVAIAAAEFAQAHARKKDGIDYADLGEYATHPQVRSNLLAVALRFEEKDKTAKVVQKYFRKVKNKYEKGFLLAALANNPQNYFFVRQQIALNQPEPINTFAFEGLYAIRNHVDFDKQNKTAEGKLLADFENLLQEIFSGNDVVLMGLAATELRNEKRNYKTTMPTILAALKTAKEKLPLPLEIEAVIEIQKTIDFFEGKTTETVSNIGFNHAIDWTVIEKLAKQPQVKIKTSKGVIIVELFVNDAPASVANFLQLSKQGFYHGKVFHRVVQNFVVQTGCPRGDGYGNVPFSIRSEFANLSYEEGYLGMASAGKDTEGSQWFITHSPTPHLDGRYSIFGRVISDMETVHLLEIGDKIEKLEVLE
jgi:cyclophilin family peptidyl-prolyl cis-trans isomerase/HEAT repeat protein